VYSDSQCRVPSWPPISPPADRYAPQILDPGRTDPVAGPSASCGVIAPARFRLARITNICRRPRRRDRVIAEHRPDSTSEFSGNPGMVQVRLPCMCRMAMLHRV
jgi:hypothetical protein